MTINVRQGTPEWLAARMQGIGASDIPVITGDSPYQSALELWSVKTGRLTPPEPDEATVELYEIGHMEEAPLLRYYESRTGRHPKRAPKMLVHRDVPWAFASLDATAPVKRAVEVKWSTSDRRWGAAGIPDDVLLQTQWQLFVTGWDVADVVALVGRSRRIVEVPRDQPLIDGLVHEATVFWEHVMVGVPPPPDSSESARLTLGRLHPRDNGTMLPATPDLVVLAAQLRNAKDATKAAEVFERGVGNAIRAIVGGASGVEGLLTLHKTELVTKTDWQGYANDLLALVPPTYEDRMRDIRAARITTGEGPRVLRLLGKGKDA